MSKPPLERDLPCPGRIVLDAGGGFAVGAVGGSFYHFAKGLRASPNGARIVGGMQAVRVNAPRVGGSFAVWGGLFSTFNCTAAYVRQKEDPWNSIVAGAASGGLLSMRQGLRAAGRSTVVGGALLALVEGMGILSNRLQLQAAQAQQNRPPVHDPNLAAAVANRVQAAQQNLPPVDDPAIAAGFQGAGDFQRPPQPAVSPTEVAGSSGDAPLGKQVEETKKPNDNDLS